MYEGFTYAGDDRVPGPRPAARSKTFASAAQLFFDNLAYRFALNAGA
jgi:hypothetical protein